MGKQRKLTGREKMVTLCVREGYICWICQGSVPVDFVEGSPDAPSRDHVIPRSQFKRDREKYRGDSFFTTNIKLAHRHCNSVRQSRSVKPEEAETYAALLKQAQEKYDFEQQGALV